MTVEILAIIYVFSTFILLLTGLPVGFILSGSALLFSLVGHTFGLFDLAYLLALPNRMVDMLSLL